MARYHVELLTAAQRLLAREEGQRGRIASARVRRSISTTYYALFHFILEECANRIVGVGPALLRRRRIAARIISTARTLIDDVQAAIGNWQAANDPASRDFKHALSLLLVLQGQLRRDDA